MRDVLARLNSKLIQCGDCWEFRGCRDRHGYGRFGIGSKVFLAHRVSYELNVGPIPENAELDHLCRNPSCCNPQHLEPVTHVENVRRGEAGKYKVKNGRCKHGHDLTDPANVYVHTRGKGNRKCKPCTLRNARESHERKKLQHVRSV